MILCGCLEQRVVEPVVLVLTSAFLICVGSRGHYSFDHLILLVGSAIAPWTRITQVTWYAFVFYTFAKRDDTLSRKNVTFL